MRNFIWGTLRLAALGVVAVVLILGFTYLEGSTDNIHRVYWDFEKTKLQLECPLNRRGRMHGEMKQFDEQGNQTHSIQMYDGNVSYANW